MQNGNVEHHFSGRGLLVEMLITLELHGIVWLKIAYLYIFKLSRHCYAGAYFFLINVSINGYINSLPTLCYSPQESKLSRVKYISPMAQH